MTTSPEDTKDLGPIGRQALDATTPKVGRVVKDNPESEFDQRWVKVEAWMRRTFEDDLARMQEKARVYGSHDLEIMAVSMEALLPRRDELDDRSRHAAAMEAAIGFYLMGKASRLFGAWKDGREPDVDSWRDSAIYSMMARWIRENGKWM